MSVIDSPEKYDWDASYMALIETDTYDGYKKKWWAIIAIPKDGGECIAAHWSDNELGRRQASECLDNFRKGVTRRLVALTRWRVIPDFASQENLKRYEEVFE